MVEPVCAQKLPYVVELEPGRYWWCSCGKSKKQPFCDGAHQGSEFSPVAIDITEKTKIGFCGCKKTKNAPRCDGTHSKP